MARPRRFPVIWVSLMLALIVASGIWHLTGLREVPDVTRPKPPHAGDTAPPALSSVPALSGSAATAEVKTPAQSEPEPAGIKPSDETFELPDLRARRIKQGPTPEHASVTGWVEMTIVARGRVILAGFRKLEATIWRLDGRERTVVKNATGLPNEVGEFGIRNLPDGEYVIEFVSEEDGSVVRVKREFRVAGYTADLGTINLPVYTGIRARVLDIDARPIEQADVVVVRPEETPEQARRLVPDRNGWVTYFDLEPDLVHQVVVLGLPSRLERPVRTPRKAKEIENVVFESTLRTIPTSVAFFIDGEPVKVQLIEGLQSDTRLKKLPNQNGILTTWMLPGTYRFWTEDREGTLVVDDRDCVRAKVHLHLKQEEGPR